MRLSTRERHDKIVAEVYARQHVTAAELSELLDVSPATVRRDLHAVADSGRIELRYGGASAPQRPDTSFRAKMVRNIEEKRRVGELAAALVGDGEQIFLDSGTTCFQMAAWLKTRKGLSVIANSARLALELDSPQAEVILLGGKYRHERMDTTGPVAMAALEQLRGYTAFIGADGLSMEFGVAASDIESAHLFRLAVKNARRTVLLVDSSKFQAPSLCKIMDFDSVDAIVTDRPVSQKWSEYLRRMNIEIITPETAPAATHRLQA